MVVGSDNRQEVFHTGGRTIPVCFDIPDDRPESRFLRENGKAYINWNLSACVKATVINCLAVFEIPVFRLSIQRPTVFIPL